MKFLMLFLIFTSSAYSRYGDERGNGGNVVICPQENGEESVHFLDYEEARNRRDILIDVGDESLNYKDIFLNLNKRIAKKDSLRAKRYLRYLESFEAETKFLYNETLLDIRANIILRCNGGKVAQLVIQKEPRFEDDTKRYFIDKNLWEKLSNKDKAGVLLHEFIMREVGYRKDPEAVRYLTSIYSSRKFEEYGIKKYLHLMTRLGFEFITYHGVPIDLKKDIELHIQLDRITSAYSLDNFLLEKFGFIFPLSGKLPILFSDWDEELNSFYVNHPAPGSSWPYDESFQQLIGKYEFPKIYKFSTFYPYEENYKLEKFNKELFSLEEVPNDIFEKIFSRNLWSQRVKIPFLL